MVVLVVATRLGMVKVNYCDSHAFTTACLQPLARRRTRTLFYHCNPLVYGTLYPHVHIHIQETSWKIDTHKILIK